MTTSTTASTIASDIEKVATEVASIIVPGLSGKLPEAVKSAFAVVYSFVHETANNHGPTSAPAFALASEIGGFVGRLNKLA